MYGGGKSLRTCRPTPNNTAASVRGLDCPIVGGWQRNDRISMMNHTDGWMNGWSGGGMWIGAVIGVVIVALLVVVIGRMSKK